MFSLQKPAQMTGRLLVIVGPTASGKTALSLQLAQRFQGQIISADSRLFYRGLDIGTAKPTAAEMGVVPHHLIDICDPGETITLGDFQDRAYQIIDEIIADQGLPILVGGTGQYVSAVVEGWGIPRVAPQPDLREALARFESEELGRWLALLDPVAATRLDPRNRRRVIRALEVILVTGQPISSLQKKTPPPLDIRLIGLTTEREHLYQRIDERVDLMMAAGFVAEVRRLLAAGYGPETPAMSGLGYRQLLDHLLAASGPNGGPDLAATVARIKFATHAFVRRQYNWFRLADPAITWFDIAAPDYPAGALHFVAAWLSEGNCG